MEGNSSSAAVPSKGAGKYLTNLPSRGLFSSTVLCSANPGSMRVYVCDHSTTPQDQLIKTNATNILIRALEMNKQKDESNISDKAPAENKGKRTAGRVADGRHLAKRSNTAGGSLNDGSSIKLTKEMLQTWTVERLRALLKERGLSTKGKKDELIARLICGNS